MKNFILNFLDFFGVIDVLNCLKCGKELTEHGWYNQKDCMNQKCPEFYYRNLLKIKE
jgi:hypothetical protein